MIDASTTNTVVITAAIAALPPTLLATAALVASLRNGKKVDTTIKEARELHVSVNSKMSEFMSLVKISSEAEGVLKEHTRQKLEDIHFAQGVKSEKDSKDLK